MYLATKYASQVLNISIDALKKSAQRGDKYPFVKLNNKLLFKVSTEQLLDALDKGLIDVNTPIFNDDLTPKQELSNSRRNNERTNQELARAITSNSSTIREQGDRQRKADRNVLSARVGYGVSNTECEGDIDDTTKQERSESDKRQYESSQEVFTQHGCELEAGSLSGCRDGHKIRTSVFGTSNQETKHDDKSEQGELNGRERNDKTPSKVCRSNGEHAIYDDKSAFRCDEKPNSSYQTALFCRLSDSNRQKSVCRNGENAGDANLANIKHNTQSSTKYKDYERTNECKNIMGDTLRGRLDNVEDLQNGRGAVDDNTTNYNANNQCDNKSLLSNENHKNEIKDSITSARANKTMSQKYKNETTNSEIYEQINKQRIENDDRKNSQNLSYSKADERLSRANRNREKTEISKTTDDVCKNDREYRCEDDGVREIGFGVSKALSTTNESKKYPSISTSQTNESSTLNECLNERESFLLENNLSHTHASLSTFLKANAKSQEIALARVHVVKEYLKLKGKIKVSEFIDLINARGILKLSERKLFLWQKAYLSGGLDALIPQYKNTKKTTLEELGLNEFFENALISEKGRINLANVYKLVHYEASARNLISLDDFLAKKDELVSYASIKRAANAFFKNNKLLKDLILYGEDGCTSRHLPALGVSNWAVNSINQIVEIDASPLDAICNTTDIATRLGIDEQLVSSWQKRYCIISLIDTYSGVVSFYLGESENSQTIARAIAKYIKLYGKPKCIHSDNGKAFLSKHIKGMLERLDIEYKAMPAYSGWCKPYVENKFKALQNSLTANLSGYIGANVGQRQAIEFFMSKKERRLKKGMKTNLAKLKDLEYMQNIIDDFTHRFLNNTFLDRLQSTPNEAYIKKQDEAICIDELSLSMYLGGSLEYRNVSSKGISLNGQIYQNPKLYNYESVYVCASLNNVSQIFCFDEQKELICVAVLIDPVVGVSVEEAKQARKLYIKALKQNKEKINKARDERERMFERYIELGKETLNSITPNPTYTNDRLLEELEYANMLVAGSDVSVKKSNVKSWEDFV